MRSPNAEFDLTLAQECAKAFSRATGLGCAVTGINGEVYGRYGYSCADCRVCALAGLSGERCGETHLYGMHEATRFGGKYVYFGPVGLTSFVSPIIGREEAVAKITVGPFLMVEVEDYIACDLQEIHKLSDERVALVREELKKVPYVEPSAVAPLSTLLFMAVGFMNNVSAANSMMHAQKSDYLQGQISSYIMELKRGSEQPDYPFRLEQVLVQSMLQSEHDRAKQCLNEILGHIMFSAGGKFRWIRARCFELLVMISRTAVRGGADPDYILRLNDEYLESIPRCGNIEELSMQLSEALPRYMNSGSAFRDARHSDAIHNAVRFIQTNYTQKITLEDTARHVYLSPTYLSRVFKQETGLSFTRFLNNVRVEKSKKLLSMTDMRLAEIALNCGFEEQSYYTKVFKAITGITPQQYRRENAGWPSRG